MDHFDKFNLPSPTTTDTSEQEIEDLTAGGEEDVHSTSEVVHICHLFSELDRTVKGSREESLVINEMITAFVPRNVEKATHKQQRQHESKEPSQSSVASSSDDVEEIEFPFAPPTLKEDSAEYHAS